MQSIHKKLVPSTHGFHTMFIPVGSTIISVGAVSNNGMVPIFVKLDTNETQNESRQLFCSVTNYLCDVADGQFLGTCITDNVSAVHVFIV